jgi:predicted nucleic acid-binding Zn ribbon protein
VKNEAAAPTEPAHAITRPLREKPGLFWTFAELESSEDEILAFADRHGWLGLEVDPRLHAELPSFRGRRVAGELRKDWVRAITQMRFACELRNAVAGRDLAWLRRAIQQESWEGPLSFSDHGVMYQSEGGGFRVTPHHPEAALLQKGDFLRAARVLMQHLANEQLELHTSARVLLDEQTGRQGLYVNPKNLLGALWIQFSESMDSSTSSRRCAECGDWMLLAPGTSRSDREFCSDRCRVNAYRKRKKAAARLHRRGMTPSAIAKKLGSDTETVRGWLGLIKKER